MLQEEEMLRLPEALPVSEMCYTNKVVLYMQIVLYKMLRTNLICF